MGIYGQDWSSYQDAQPNTTGLSFAFVKVTEGQSYVNPKWVSQRDHAKANGLVWGGYHYPHMANSPKAEADYFLSQVNWRPGDLLALDWEGYDSANRSVSHAGQLAYKDAWLRYVKQRMPHNPVGLYCNTDYWLHVDTTSYYADFLWITTSGRPAGDPGIQAAWLFHQYGSDTVDHDYCHLPSIGALHTWTQSVTARAAPAPRPGRSVEEDSMAAFTEDDIRRFIREEVSSTPVRDTIAYAVHWWLAKAVTDTPVPAASGQPWGELLPQLTAALRQLPPPALQQLQVAVSQAVKASTVHAGVTLPNQQSGGSTT